ncbi:hypothetical protein RchiOBHm_Chr4g0405061 [Rosa chinensis]|uniref:Uncharacterized protein n=1 Tax=Rosa chinensis TaxID=74649 RepID=A0A2P6QU08_ROSCH|nr:hypothetical protein RchiOBHm_Chr4g0405061 [Rosa chinensis]
MLCRQGQFLHELYKCVPNDRILHIENIHLCAQTPLIEGLLRMALSVGGATNMARGVASLSLSTLTSSVPCSPILAVTFLNRAIIWTRTSRSIPKIRVSLLAPSLRGATIIGLRNMLCFHRSRIIVLHKDVVMLFSDIHSFNELMKPCGPSCCNIDLIVLSNH